MSPCGTLAAALLGLAALATSSPSSIRGHLPAFAPPPLLRSRIPAASTPWGSPAPARLVRGRWSCCAAEAAAAQAELRRGDVVELEVTGLASAGAAKGGGGQGVARHGGMVIFVAGGLPGALVDAEVTKVGRGFAEARVRGVKRESEHARDPGCAHWHEGCGGCAYLGMEYEPQLSFKRGHVVDVLDKVGGFEGVEVTGPERAASSERYRNSMTFTFGEGGDGDGGTVLGLHGRGAHDAIVDVEECLLPSEPAARVFREAKRLLLSSPLLDDAQREAIGLRRLQVRSSSSSGGVLVAVETRERGAEPLLRVAGPLAEACPEMTGFVNVFPEDARSGGAKGPGWNAKKSRKERRGERVVKGKGRGWSGGGGPGRTGVDEDGGGLGGAGVVVLRGDGHLEHEVRGLRFRVGAQSFFQTNTAETEALYGAVEDFVRGGEHGTVLDLYCGSGTIGLCVARNTGADLVIGLEQSEEAVRDARRNAEANGVTNAHFAAGDVPSVLARVRQLGLASLKGFDPELKGVVMPEKCDVAVVDPPRRGVGEDGVRDLIALRPPRIVYVSCNPSTLARDASLLRSDGGYVLRAVRCVDMFPNTPHIECVALLELEGEG